MKDNEIDLILGLDVSQAKKKLKSFKENFKDLQKNINKRTNKDFNRAVDYGMTNNASYFGLSSLLASRVGGAIRSASKVYSEFEKNLVRRLGITGKELTKENYRLEKNNVLKNSYDSILGINKYLESNKYFLKKGFSREYTGELTKLTEQIDRYFDVPIEVAKETISTLAKQFNFSKKEISGKVSMLTRASDLTSIDFETFTRGLSSSKVSPFHLKEDFANFLTVFSVLRNKGYSDASAGNFYNSYLGGINQTIQSLAYNLTRQISGNSNITRQFNLFRKNTDAKKSFVNFLQNKDGSSPIKPLDFFLLLNSNDKNIRKYFSDMLQGHFQNNNEFEQILQGLTEAFKKGAMSRDNVRLAGKTLLAFGKQEFRAREDVIRGGKLYFKKGRIYNKKDRDKEIIKGTEGDQLLYTRMIFEQSENYLKKNSDFMQRTFGETIKVFSNRLTRTGLIFSESLNGFISMLSKSLSGFLGIVDKMRQESPNAFNLASTVGGFALGGGLLSLFGIGALGATRAFSRFSSNEVNALRKSVYERSNKMFYARELHQAKKKGERYFGGKYDLYEQEDFKDRRREFYAYRKKKYKEFDIKANKKNWGKEQREFEAKYRNAEIKKKEEEILKDYISQQDRGYKKLEKEINKKRGGFSFANYNTYRRNGEAEDYQKHSFLKSLMSEDIFKYTMGQTIADGFISSFKMIYNSGGIMGAIANKYATSMMLNKKMKPEQLDKIISKNKKGFFGFRGLQELLELLLISKGLDKAGSIVKNSKGKTLVGQTLLKAIIRLGQNLIKFALPITLISTGFIALKGLFDNRKKILKERNNKRGDLYNFLKEKHGTGSDADGIYNYYGFSTNHDSNKILFSEANKVKEGAKNNISLFRQVLNMFSKIFNGTIAYLRGISATVFNQGIINNAHLLPKEQRDILKKLRDSGVYHTWRGFIPFKDFFTEKTTGLTYANYLKNQSTRSLNEKSMLSKNPFLANFLGVYEKLFRSTKRDGVSYLDEEHDIDKLIKKIKKNTEIVQDPLGGVRDILLYNKESYGELVKFLKSMKQKENKDVGAERNETMINVLGELIKIMQKIDDDFIRDKNNKDIMDTGMIQQPVIISP